MNNQGKKRVQMYEQNNRIMPGVATLPTLSVVTEKV